MGEPLYADIYFPGEVRLFGASGRLQRALRAIDPRGVRTSGFPPKRHPIPHRRSNGGPYPGPLSDFRQIRIGITTASVFSSSGGVMREGDSSSWKENRISFNWMALIASSRYRALNPIESGSPA